MATTRGGSVAVRLAISMGGVEVKYKVYLRKKDIELQFHSPGQRRTELAARLLRPDRASTDSLAIGRKELRIALIKAVARAVERGWVSVEKASRWLEKLERGSR